MRRDENGFTLLEVVVALAVFSLGALALLNVVGESSRSQASNEDRFLALVVAENRLVDAMAHSRPPPPGEVRGLETSLGRAFDWRMTTAPTSDPRILRIDAVVRLEGGEHILASLSTFRAVTP